MRALFYRLWISISTALALACGGGGLGGGDKNPAVYTVTVSPTGASLAFGETLNLTAYCSRDHDDGGTYIPDVNWSIQEGPTGGMVVGLPDANGRKGWIAQYTTPPYSLNASPKIFHLVAASVADPSKTVVVPVTMTLPTGTFAFTGPMSNPRDSHTATLLPNGKVLVVGGLGGPGILWASAELYDPATGVFTATGAMSDVKRRHTATLLANGKVLVVGTSRPELYDPATGTFSTTGALNSNTARYGHTATLLANGKVLIAGGNSDYPLNSDLSEAELYDPATGTFTPTGPMGAARAGHIAVLLQNGFVLISGGNSGLSAELFDPTIGKFTLTGSMINGCKGATLLPNGEVFLVGDWGKSHQVYSPDTGTFTSTGLLGMQMSSVTVTLLSNGKILIVGGGIANLAELIDPTTPLFTSIELSTASGDSHTATLLSNGFVLIAGGQSSESPYPVFSRTELYLGVHQ